MRSGNEKGCPVPDSLKGSNLFFTPVPQLFEQGGGKKTCSGAYYTEDDGACNILPVQVAENAKEYAAPERIACRCIYLLCHCGSVLLY